MNEPVAREGILFVVSAPSGAGKTSLCRRLIDSFPEIRQSISYTTRPPRSDERTAVDYHFVDVPLFEQMVCAGRFAEWAQVHGNFYGTAVDTLDRAAAEGVDVLLDIDFQGAAQLKTKYGRGVFVFILPPDLGELERRLRLRGTDSEDVILRRLAKAREEISQAVWYDYLVVNDDLTSAGEALNAIVTAERCRSLRNIRMLQQMTT